MARNSLREWDADLFCTSQQFTCSIVRGETVDSLEDRCLSALIKSNECEDGSAGNALKADRRVFNAFKSWKYGTADIAPFFLQRDCSFGLERSSTV